VAAFLLEVALSHYAFFHWVAPLLTLTSTTGLSGYRVIIISEKKRVSIKICWPTSAVGRDSFLGKLLSGWKLSRASNPGGKIFLAKKFLSGIIIPHWLKFTKIPPVDNL
jgi:hypothetical protein